MSDDVCKMTVIDIQQGKKSVRWHSKCEVCGAVMHSHYSPYEVHTSMHPCPRKTVKGGKKIEKNS